MVVMLFVLLVLFWGLEVVGYLFRLPGLTGAAQDDRPCGGRYAEDAAHVRHEQTIWRHPGTVLYGVAYVLSLLRAPLGLLPYLVKVGMMLGLGIRYEARRTTYRRELLNMLGDIANLALSWGAVALLIGPPRWHWLALCGYLPLWAESARLLAERAPITFSAAWQLMPHERIAGWLARKRAWSALERYIHYYTLSDEGRAAYVLETLKERAAGDGAVAERLAYLNAFRIVPRWQALRGGLVRDVARGEVFIHAVWTKDPWLLIGMALRRSPWSFDPRYLRRPFAYMSQANRVMSLFVLRHARYSLPYALFQFGHEIRVARLHCFYVLLRWLGLDIERRVSADGTFQNDQLIFWLRQRLTSDPALQEPRPLASTEEVIDELAEMPEGERGTALEIAERYVYPLSYVEQVLLPEVMQHEEEMQHESGISHMFTGHA